MQLRKMKTREWVAVSSVSFTGSRVVSVSWPLLKPDWFGSMRSFLEGNAAICFKSALSGTRGGRPADSFPLESGGGWWEVLPIGGRLDVNSLGITLSVRGVSVGKEGKGDQKHGCTLDWWASQRTGRW